MGMTYEVDVERNDRLDFRITQACHSVVLDSYIRAWIGLYQVRDSWAMFLMYCDGHWTIRSNDQNLLSYLVNDFGLKTYCSNIRLAKQSYTSGDYYLNGKHRGMEEINHENQH